MNRVFGFDEGVLSEVRSLATSENSTEESFVLFLLLEVYFLELIIVFSVIVIMVFIFDFLNVQTGVDDALQSHHDLDDVGLLVDNQAVPVSYLGA